MELTQELRVGKRAALRTGGGHTIASAEQTAVRWVRPRVARARDEVGNAERGGDAMMNVHVSPPPAHDDDGALAAGVGGTGA